MSAAHYQKCGLVAKWFDTPGGNQMIDTGHASWKPEALGVFFVQGSA